MTGSCKQEIMHPQQNLNCTTY